MALSCLSHACQHLHIYFISLLPTSSNKATSATSHKPCLCEITMLSFHPWQADLRSACMSASCEEVEEIGLCAAVAEAHELH